MFHRTEQVTLKAGVFVVERASPALDQRRSCTRPLADASPAFQSLQKQHPEAPLLLRGDAALPLARPPLHPLHHLDLPLTHADPGDPAPPLLLHGRHGLCQHFRKFLLLQRRVRRGAWRGRRRAALPRGGEP